MNQGCKAEPVIGSVECKIGLLVGLSSTLKLANHLMALGLPQTIKYNNEEATTLSAYGRYS